MALRDQIAKFKVRQYQLRALSPNLMLTKVSRYTVYCIAEKFSSRLNLTVHFCNCQISQKLMKVLKVSSES